MEVVIFGKLIFLIADMSLYQVYAVVEGSHYLRRCELIMFY